MARQRLISLQKIMHSHIINASLQLIPLAHDRHPYEWVDEIIGLINESGLAFSVGAFGTTVEGSYADITGLIDRINSVLLEKQCPEWLLNVQWHIRGGGSVTMEEKTGKWHP